MELIQNWAAAIRATFDQFVEASAAHVPNLVAAIVLLIVGWVLARSLRALIERLGSGLDSALAPTRERIGLSFWRWDRPLSKIIGQVVFWVVILFFVTAVAGTLGLPGLVEWLGRLIAYVPALFAAAVIVLFGYWLSAIVGRLASSGAATAGYAQPALLGRAASGMTLVVAVILAVDQLGFDITLLVNLITIALAALLGGLAFAFGIGAGPAVSNIVASRYVGRTFEIGQRVRVGTTEGNILEFNATSVTLETQEGRAEVPAKLFHESVILLVERDAEPNP